MFSHGFKEIWNIHTHAPFPDHCLLVPSYYMYVVKTDFTLLFMYESYYEKTYSQGLNPCKAETRFDPSRGKTNNVVFDQVRHIPGCTGTGDSKNLEISDLRRRGIVLSE